MRSKRPIVIATRKLPIETGMMELFSCRLNLDDKAFSNSELEVAVSKTDVLVPTVTDRIDAQVLVAPAPSLKLIASFGTGGRSQRPGWGAASGHHRDEHPGGVD
jgi:glyoxylate reductase